MNDEENEKMAKMSEEEKRARAEKKAEGLKILKNLDRNTIDSYISEFDGKQEIAEAALKEVFEKYGGSSETSEVFIVVQMLNQLYSAGLDSNEPLEGNTSKKVNVYMMARALAENAEHISGWLADKNPCTAVNNILAMFPDNLDRPYSFVSKYCSWRKNDKYPIADSYSKGVLYYFFGKEIPQKDYGKYEVFCEQIDKFKESKRAEGLSVKSIDKFLWSFGKKYGIQI